MLLNSLHFVSCSTLQVQSLVYAYSFSWHRTWMPISNVCGPVESTRFLHLKERFSSWWSVGLRVHVLATFVRDVRTYLSCQKTGIFHSIGCTFQSIAMVFDAQCSIRNV